MFSALLLAANGTYSRRDWCWCVSSRFLQIATTPTVFLRFSQNLGHTQYICANTQKMWNRFSKFWF